eukprot:Em0007g1482a
MWLTVDEIKKQDTKGEIQHLEDVCKIIKDVTGIMCISVPDVDWVRTKLRNECNRWSYHGECKPEGMDKNFKEFSIDEGCQPSKLSLPKLGIEAGTNPVPRLRIEQSIIPDKLEQTTGKFYQLQIIEGKVKMTPAECHKH